MSVSERVNGGLPTINDVQVILSFVETRVIPARPASTRFVNISNFGETGTSRAILIRPSVTRVSNDVGNNPTVVVVGELAEADTGYFYDALFGNEDTSGHRCTHLVTLRWFFHGEPRFREGRRVGDSADGIGFGG